MQVSRTHQHHHNRLWRTFATALPFIVVLFCTTIFTATHKGYAQGSVPLQNFPTFNGTVDAIVLSGGTIYVGGAFTQATDAPVNGGGSLTRNRLAAIDAGTGALLAWNPDADDDVLTLAISGATVYVGGRFGTINGGTPRTSICAVSAATGIATAWAPTVNSTVRDIALSGANVYVAGAFNMVEGMPQRGFAAFSSVTGLSTGWNPNSNSSGFRILINGTTAFVTGFFTTIGGSARNNAAAVDITTGTATGWNPNPNSATLDALAVNGATMLMGGGYTTIGGSARNHVAAVNLTTGAANGWNPDSDGFLYSIAVNGATVYAGGDFGTIGGQARGRIGAVDATTGIATSWNPDADGAAYTLAPNGGRLYAGGIFTTIGGLPHQGFAVFGPASATYTLGGTTIAGNTVSESAANDGSVSSAIDVRLTGEQWAPAGAFTLGTDFTATGVPVGLTIAITRVSPFVARISFTGSATAHANANDATATINFLNASITSGSVVGIAGLNPGSIVIDFNDPLPPPPPPPPAPPIAPVITSFSPTSAPPEAVVTIRGGYFSVLSQSVSQVFFGDFPALRFEVVSDSVIRATVGAGGTGVIRVVTSKDGLTAVGSSSDVFTFIPPPLISISSFSPAGGKPGDVVVIRGENLFGVKGVFFGSFPARSFRVISSTELHAVIGEVGTGGGVPVILVGDKNTVSKEPFGLMYTPPPILFAVEPTVVVEGDEDFELLLTGERILPSALVQLNGTNGTVLQNDSRKVLVRFAGRLRTVGGKTVTLINPDNQSTSATMSIVPFAPIVTAVTPSVTRATQQVFTVMLAGSRFSATAQILVNGFAAKRTLWSATRASVEIPAAYNVRSTTLTIELRNHNGYTTSATVEVLPPFAPVIDAVKAQSEHADASLVVTLEGRHFGAAAKVYLSATPLSVLEASEQRLVVVIPAALRPTVANSVPAVLLVINPDDQMVGVRWQVPFVGAALSKQSTTVSAPQTLDALSESVSNASTLSNAVNETPFDKTIVVYPNPASDVVTVQANLEKPTSVQVRLLTALGESLFTRVEQANAGQWRTSIPLHHVPAGVYIVEWNHDGNRATTRFVKR